MVRRVRLAYTVDGETWDQVIEFRPGQCREIGRGSVDLQIQHPSVSRRHCALTLDSGGQSVRLIDQGSKNGTFQSGRKIRQASLLSGDRVRLGEISLRLVSIEQGSKLFEPVWAERVHATAPDPFRNEERASRLALKLDQHRSIVSTKKFWLLLGFVLAYAGGYGVRLRAMLGWKAYQPTLKVLERLRPAKSPQTGQSRASDGASYGSGSSPDRP